jgi:quinohemoprotein ethanol dehydrogenase
MQAGAPGAIRAAAALFMVLTISFGAARTTGGGKLGPVDGSRIANAERDPGNWLTYGRTYSEQRYSPLMKITADNVNRLGLAWFADLDSNRGQESTPLVIDGVMFVSTAWSLVKAYDARSGRLLWSYDPKVPRELGVKACSDVVNRGLAAWKGKIFVATFDGRIVALNATTGKPVWSKFTAEKGEPSTITQAPRVIKGRVIIGMSAGDYGVRGYISAYDAATGGLAWRFYTVPGDPSQPFENAAMAMAAKTWSGGSWKHGGGGVWDAISYDPDLNLLYFGVGNGLECSRDKRGDNDGDDLFLSSIVALNADTGEYVWHYQVVPGDERDYDAVAQLVLADLKIDGNPRQVLMQANKDGFFYILDRKTGELLSAKDFVFVNWASGIDMKTGRPIAHENIHYSITGKSIVMIPGPDGAHSWHPMAYNPGTGLAYIPAQEMGKQFTPLKDFNTSPMSRNLGVEVTGTPEIKEGFLLAWDPVNQKEAWRVNYRGPWNGGIVTTAGNLVVQGNASGEFAVYRADSGQKQWAMDVQSPTMGGPVTYEVDGEQYIAVLSGWGSNFALQHGQVAALSGNPRNVSRVLAFKLGGSLSLPPLEPRALTINPPPDATAIRNYGIHRANQDGKGQGQLSHR